MNTAMGDNAGFGIQTAAVTAGGTTGAGNYQNNSELYNGSSWTATPTLNSPRRASTGIGTSTAGYIVAGQTSGGGVIAQVEQWNGSGWTETTDTNTATRGRGASASGTITAAIVFGGHPSRALTESWNGSAWTEVGDLNEGRMLLGGMGVQTSALASGGDDGGGGGSGYTDGSVTVVKTTQGGSTGSARINIKLSAGDFFIDSEGRILIFSTNDNRDPRTLTKTTGVVNYGDNTCIDDARWQNFLDLARDGTQDYRLAVTTNNSTTKITGATEKNIYKMMTANVNTLSTSLTDWEVAFSGSGEYAIAWDDDEATYSGGSDYSGILWNDGTTYTSGYAYYGGSKTPSFTPTNYHFTSANWWILPPGVPDF